MLASPHVFPSKSSVESLRPSRNVLPRILVVSSFRTSFIVFLDEPSILNSWFWKSISFSFWSDAFDALADSLLIFGSSACSFSYFGLGSFLIWLLLWLLRAWCCWWCEWCRSSWRGLWLLLIDGTSTDSLFLRLLAMRRFWRAWWGNCAFINSWWKL